METCLVVLELGNNLNPNYSGTRYTGSQVELTIPEISQISNSNFLYPTDIDEVQKVDRYLNSNKSPG